MCKLPATIKLQLKELILLRKESLILHWNNNHQQSVQLFYWKVFLWCWNFLYCHRWCLRRCYLWESYCYQVNAPWSRYPERKAPSELFHKRWLIRYLPQAALHLFYHRKAPDQESMPRKQQSRGELVISQSIKMHRAHNNRLKMHEYQTLCYIHNIYSRYMTFMLLICESYKPVSLDVK